MENINQLNEEIRKYKILAQTIPGARDTLHSLHYKRDNLVRLGVVEPLQAKDKGENK